MLNFEGVDESILFIKLEIVPSKVEFSLAQPLVQEKPTYFFRIFGQIQLNHQLLPLANLDGCECRSAPNVPRHLRWENVSKIFHIDGWVCGYLCWFRSLTWKIVVGIILKYSQVRKGSQPISCSKGQQFRPQKVRKDCFNGWGSVIPRFLEKFLSEVSLKRNSAVACQMGLIFEGIKLDAKMHGKF